ncbi:SAM-dependent methyltransferase [Thermocatellispora tengchongensis]|uniref:SAM-dependent methyltransferase n=1 Tax=Thermocatellispora tengchongensis TaxID=1073253 RepID=A0A840PTK5_9ACTN|nr:methyltransferase domain-containing protein [Thermocatellispora tengchongensis]MBB5139255.1 SAM-dependent methyltransferase [Thermocatellispora tengchongensis]
MNVERVREFAGELGRKRAATGAVLLSYLGDRLGIWRAMAGAGPLGSAELAERTGLAERYLREWLAAQTVAGHVRYHPDTGRFELPDEHAAVLADETSPAFQGGALECAAAFWFSADRVAGAFRTGAGVGWHEHDPRLHTGVARFFEPLYRMSVVDQWLPALDGVADRLRAGAHVLDVGCGHGTSTILMATAFPGSHFLGVDYHEESVLAARAAAVKAGVEDRVEFLVAGSESYPAGSWDLICFFDALHDLGAPVEAAVRARSSLTPGGTLMVVEPFSRDRLEDSVGDPVALGYYTASTMACVPNSVAQHGAALGAQAGPERLHAVLREAGFGRVRTALETPYNLVLEARA